MCKFEDARGGRDATCASNMDASSRLPEDDVRGHQRDHDEDVGGDEMARFSRGTF